MHRIRISVENAFNQNSEIDFLSKGSLKKTGNSFVWSNFNQPLLGELVMSWRERKKERKRKNAIYSGHLSFCQQPRAAHALHSDQFPTYVEASAIAVELTDFTIQDLT